MAMKGMEMGLKVLFVVVAILVVVIVLLAMFMGGAGDIGKVFTDWIRGVPSEPKACNLYNNQDASQCTIFAGCQCCKVEGKLCTDCRQAGVTCPS